jgi:hypothetical protein
MSLSASPLHPQSIARSLLTLSVTVIGLIVLLPLPAHAKAFGDVVVGPQQTEREVSTAIGDVTVDGVVQRDVHSGFGNVLVNEHGGVGGNIDAGFGDVEVYGPVAGGVDAGFGNVYIDAPVRGNVEVGRGDVDLGPGGQVYGNVYYGSGEFRGNRDAVLGTVATGGMRPDVDQEPMEHEPDGFGIFDFLGWIFATAAYVACSVLVAVLAPGPLLAAARRADESPGWSLLFGVISVPAVVVLCVVLAVSVVGIPILLLLAPAYLAFVFFGALVAAYFVGRRVVLATGRYHVGNALAAVVGALIIAAAYLIPFLGGILLYGFALFGAGASILALFSRRPRTTYASYETYVQNQRETRE